MIETLRRDPWLAAGLWVAVIASMVPLWLADLLPFQDLPQHLAAVRTIHSLDDPFYGLSKYHVVDLARTQYLSWYLALDWLTYLMPLETANRVVLSAYVAAVPLSVFALLRAVGRDPAACLLAAPLAFNVYLYMGFGNYVMALPMVLWGLALLVRLLDSWHPRRALGLALLVVVIFYTHVQALLMYLGLAAIVVFVRAPGLHPRHWWRPASHVLPTLGLLGWWMSQSLILASGADWTAGHGGRNTTDTKVRFDPLMARLEATPKQLLDVFTDDKDELLLLSWAALMIVVLLLGWRRGQAATNAPTPAKRPNWRAILRARLPLVLVCASAVVYVLSPISYKWIWPISHRLVPLVALLAVVAVGFVTMPGRRTLLIIPATALAIAASMTHVDHIKRFNKEAGPILEVVRAADPGKRLVGLMFDRDSAVINRSPYLHFAQYYVVERGGMANFSFANMPQSPVVYPTVDGPPTLRARWEWLPHLFNYTGDGRYYDYYLIRGHSGRARSVFGGHVDEVDLVLSKGPWHLYRRKAAFGGTASAGEVGG